MAKIAPYEQYTDEYDGWFAGNRLAYESELQAVRLLVPPGGKGLEIGVGTGRFAAPLGVAFGVEPSAAMRRIARERGIHVAGGIAEALPFRDARFDFALMITTLCFFDDAEAAFMEARRVLAPAGSLIIGFIDRDSPIGKTYEERKSESRFFRLATFYSAREVIALLERSGFRPTAVRQTIFGMPKEMNAGDPVREGHGEGCFVVVRAEK